MAGRYKFTQTTAELQTIMDRVARLSTIVATDLEFGAVGDYTGDMTTTGTGTDNREMIQAALDAAHVPGASFGDALKGVSYRVVLPAGKYYISARSDGMPSLHVPLKVQFDFSEAQLFFQIPLRNYTANGITEPNPHWCGILVGNYGGLKVGKMQCIWGSDATYGGAWYGMHLDAIRVQEADISFIEGDSTPHQIFNFRGAGIRYLAPWNAFCDKLSIANCAFGVVVSYYGNAFPDYQRYRTGGTLAENASTSVWMNKVSFLNMGRMAVMVGAGGDWFDPGTPTHPIWNGLETVVNDGRPSAGGPISFEQCAFERCAFGAVHANCPIGAVFMNDCRSEECDDATTSIGVFYANSTTFKVNGFTFSSLGLTTLTRMEYDGPNTSNLCVPELLFRSDGSNVSPVFQNIFTANSAINSCIFFSSGANGRLPTIINNRSNSPAQMQGVGANVKGIIFPNDGGRIWSISTVGFTPTEAADGARTTFTFLNGNTPQRPNYIVSDGIIMEATDVAGTNWTWASGTGVVTMTVAPTKSIRAFF